MTTIGDSFAVVAILFGIGLTTWALILASALIFPGKVTAAQERYSARPWQGFGVGLLVALTVGLVSVVMASLPVPIIKFMGTGGLMMLLAISAMGSAGLCQLMAQRIRVMEPNISPYAALTRASMVVAIGGLFPVLGWFFLGPVLLITSLGVGTQALLARAQGSEVRA